MRGSVYESHRNSEPLFSLIKIEMHIGDSSAPAAEKAGLGTSGSVPRLAL